MTPSHKDRVIFQRVNLTEAFVRLMSPALTVFTIFETYVENLQLTVDVEDLGKKIRSKTNPYPSYD